MKWFTAAVCVVVLGGAVSACGSGTETASGADTDGVCTAERAGGSITYGSPVSAVTFDPNLTAASNASTGAFELAAVYDTLLGYDLETKESSPRILESVEANADSTEWTLTIADGVEFGNGDPLDAAAFVASVERSKSAQTQGLLLGQAIRLLDTIEATDPNTVVFRFTGPWAEFGDLLATRPFMIVNTKIADERGDQFGTNPVGAGAGPYEFVSIEPGEEIILKAKENYWGGPVCIENVRIIPTEKPRLAADTLKTGEIDLTTIGDPIVSSELESDGFAGESIPGAALDLLVPNVAPGRPGADIDFRRAMAAAVDPEVVNQRAFEGALETATGIVVGDDSPYYSDALEGPTYDLDAAKQYVAEAKSNGWDGTTRLLGREGQDELVLAVQAMLEAAGMQVTTAIVPTTELVQRVSIQKDFDIALWQLTSGTGNVWASLNRFSTGAPRNDSGWSDPEMDAALAGVRQASTSKERQDAMLTLQDLWNDTVPAVIVADRPTRISQSDRLHSVSTSGFDYAVLNSAFVTD